MGSLPTTKQARVSDQTAEGTEPLGVKREVDYDPFDDAPETPSPGVDELRVPDVTTDSESDNAQIPNPEKFNPQAALDELAQLTPKLKPQPDTILQDDAATALWEAGSKLKEKPPPSDKGGSSSDKRVVAFLTMTQTSQQLLTHQMKSSRLPSNVMAIHGDQCVLELKSSFTDRATV